MFLDALGLITCQRKHLKKCSSEDFRRQTIVFVDAQAIDIDAAVEAWMSLCLAYNSHPKSAKVRLAELV